MRAFLFPICLVMALLIPMTAQAVVISNVTQGTVLFSDSFEGAPGVSHLAAPDDTGDYNPVPSMGSYLIQENPGSTMQVANFSDGTSAGPGAAQGSNYLRIYNNGGHEYQADVVTAPLSGDHINVKFMAYFTANTGGNQAIFKIRAGGLGTDIQSAGAWAGADGVVMNYNGDATSLTYAVGQWQKWEFDYVIGQPNYTMSVGGVSSGPIPNTLRGGPANIQGLGFWSGVPNTSFYLDTVPDAVVNGNFENTAGWGAVGTTNPPAGWSIEATNPASQQAGTAAIGGSGTSAYMSSAGNGQTISQTFTPIGPQWTYQVDFAASDPGVDGTSASRTCDMALNFNGGNIYFRVVDEGNDGLGDIQFHNSAGDGWTTVAALQNSATFSPDSTGAPAANHLEIVSHFDLASPTYDAIVTNALGVKFTATGLSLFNTGIPVTGSSPQTMSLCSEFNGNSWVADNVQLQMTLVPEPSSVVLLVTGLIGLVCYAWWKRK